MNYYYVIHDICVLITPGRECAIRTARSHPRGHVYYNGNIIYGSTPQPSFRNTTIREINKTVEIKVRPKTFRLWKLPISISNS